VNSNIFLEKQKFFPLPEADLMSTSLDKSKKTAVLKPYNSKNI
jgi:hypothetical protein